MATLMLCIFSISITFFAFPYLVVDFGYLVRPIWDKSLSKWDQIIVHYYAPGMSMKERCEAHGWVLAEPVVPTATIPKTRIVYDAVVFSQELDMLEIRINELWDVVDKFLILESNSTFTGLPKQEVFKQNRDRFAFAESKIVYKSIPLYPLKPDQLPWVNEGRMRGEMTLFLQETGVQDGDLVIFADVDEIQARHTIELIKSCEGVPDDLHFQLRNFLYSYEFPVNDEGNWRSSIHKWSHGKTRYMHGQSSTILLSDAGSHCSFCFRTIEEFRFKMKAYSHADRVRYSYMMEPEWIQQVICEGKDLFGMFPEAYSFRELFSRLGAMLKSTSAVYLPKYVLEHRERFKFLLPGGCIREGPLKEQPQLQQYQQEQQQE
ncbi:beta-1,4-mannosyl-glyco protein 4-beta-N-acetylglucosaminyltransferase-like protein [Lobosporangium transversale]|uniref:Beta-1,4-mannosyl-glyco protein 4-beta-N-acetylglucosaminyltransferase-like protein n=1 Tax=Lobosporangium transversale TaxID=64571 RepID=A0A1Y2GNV7_9FUNG|nr:beta-1,4-mannosyl-glyco protein 4-beta-N-acetylglucosaminyltransferase-like protein [Lobosporangium transversale]ORZ16852.1 beta-1,4-mannosyl-glyco protein 4-beta-N-acetylglucosaminyltransferase-like protein [Lobosporangium transversale]|eukprot:XP_021881787.1 beta-1,4-mannosyl-glyco protein 4-beta-N-acetylglucosaminyltransferase-like protein [Lobosporangium transversale]